MSSFVDRLNNSYPGMGKDVRELIQARKGGDRQYPSHRSDEGGGKGKGKNTNAGRKTEHKSPHRQAHFNSDGSTKDGKKPQPQHSKGEIGKLATQVVVSGNTMEYKGHDSKCSLYDAEGANLSKKVGRNVCESSFMSPLKMPDNFQHCTRCSTKGHGPLGKGEARDSAQHKYTEAERTKWRPHFQKPS